MRTKNICIIISLAMIINVCTTFHITERRVEKYEDILNQSAKTILDSEIVKSSTKKITNKVLKKNLQKLNIHRIEVELEKGHIGYDSIIVLSRISFPLTVEEIIIDFSKQHREMKNLNKIHNKIYYRKFVPIS